MRKALVKWYTAIDYAMMLGVLSAFMGFISYYLTGFYIPFIIVGVVLMFASVFGVVIIDHIDHKTNSTHWKPY